MRVTLLQFNVGEEKDKNLRIAVDLARKAVEVDRTDLIIMPEMSSFMCGDPVLKREGAEGLTGPFAASISALASELGVNINLGSIVEGRENKLYNTSAVFGRDGRLLGQYSKIHRFDVALPNGVEVRESDTIEAGAEIVVTDVDDVPTGFAICYDLRFGELFRKLAEAGARLIVVPSAFLQATGMDHWEVLVRARAIETQCYIAAPNQTGMVEGGRLAMFGHSMIVDPWGQVIAQMSNREGFVTGTIDLDYLTSVRLRIPVDKHRVLQ